MFLLSLSMLLLSSSLSLLYDIIFIKCVHVLQLSAVVYVLSRNYPDSGGFSRDPLQAGPLSTRL